MFFRKPKRGPVSDSDGAKGAHRLVGARPVEHGCGSYFGSLEKNPTAHGGQGACPLGLPPPLGERGGHPRNFHASSKNSRGFLQSRIFFPAGHIKHFTRVTSLNATDPGKKFVSSTSPGAVWGIVTSLIFLFLSHILKNQKIVTRQ